VQYQEQVKEMKELRRKIGYKMNKQCGKDEDACRDMANVIQKRILRPFIITNRSKRMLESGIPMVALTEDHG
jgi:hypothetical protein